MKSNNTTIQEENSAIPVMDSDTEEETKFDHDLQNQTQGSFLDEMQGMQDNSLAFHDDSKDDIDLLLEQKRLSLDTPIHAQ